jgi:transcriptional regulator with XRE-family HTH domain
MTFSEKVYKQMLLRGLNQQRLAQLSSVSDSEVSRVLRGKSSPSLEYAHRLAKALGVSLDYLADDELEVEPATRGDGLEPAERELLELARDLGHRQSRRVLETTLDLGYEVATRRLLGLDAGKPIVERDDAAGRAPGSTRASSA